MSAYFPLGLESYNNTLYGPLGTAEYATWKGTGKYSYPVAITSGNARPLTNNDPTNNAIQKHGLPRPLKWQFRKAKNAKTVITLDPNDPSKYIEISRESKNSFASVGQLIDRPGQFVVKHNPKNEIDERLQSQTDCKTCDGVSLVTSFAPETFLTNNPEPSSTNPKLCCNEERKAKQRVLPANTNLPKNYFTTIQQYHQNRCQTYDQRAFNFETVGNPASKPGTPQAIDNAYVANCYPNTVENSQYELTQKCFAIIKMNPAVLTAKDIQDFYNDKISTLPELATFLKTIQGDSVLAQTIFVNFINNPYIGGIPTATSTRGCKKVYYKPSNPQFAVEGGVSSSERILKLTVDTISSNVTSLRRLRGSSSNTINVGGQPFVPFIYKNKVQTETGPSSIPVYYRNHSASVAAHNVCKNKEDHYWYKAFSKMGNIGGAVNGTQITDIGYTNV
jgi:hypothetical protein